jgi:gliding motility-associated-like protein
MRTILNIIFFLFVLVAKSQQTIELCLEDDLTFNYKTESSVNGQITWTLNGEEFNIEQLVVDWSDYSLGNYEISAIQNNNDCPSNMVYLMVTLLECSNTTMWVPNSFTPDGDNVNDIWKPKGYNYLNESFFIVNQWGVRIFESNNLNYGWDGTYNGLMCQDGVYVYLLTWKDVNNRIHQKFGHIILIK